MTIKQKIEQEYGTINKFVDAHYKAMPISRTHFYNLVNGRETNPSVQTLKALAKVVGMTEEEVIREYCERASEDSNDNVNDANSDGE